MKKLKPSVTAVAWKNHGDRSKWLLQGFRENGKPIRLFFATRALAEAELIRRRDERDNIGKGAEALTAEDRINATKAMQALTPFGKTLADAVAHYTEYLSRAAKSATVADLFGQYLVALKADGRGPRHLRDVKSRIGRFCDNGFADRLVSTVETREIDDWLRGLELAPTSRNNFRTVTHGFFSFAIARGYCVSNPVAGTAKAKMIRTAPEIFTPAQLRSLLVVADSKIIPALVIGAFAGLRSAEIDRLDWSEIDLAAGYIKVESHKSKSGARRLVTIQPNLKTWLTPLAHQSGPVRAPFWTATKLMAEARTAAKLVKWPDNGLRHSFASYHLAQFKNAAGLALELGHTTSGLLFAHYRELVRPDAATEWWGIMPAAEAANMVQFAS